MEDPERFPLLVTRDGPIFVGKFPGLYHSVYIPEEIEVRADTWDELIAKATAALHQAYNMRGGIYGDPPDEVMREDTVRTALLNGAVLAYINGPVDPEEVDEERFQHTAWVFTFVLEVANPQMLFDDALRRWRADPDNCELGEEIASGDHDLGTREAPNIGMCLREIITPEYGEVAGCDYVRTSAERWSRNLPLPERDIHTRPQARLTPPPEET